MTHTTTVHTPFSMVDSIKQIQKRNQQQVNKARSILSNKIALDIFITEMEKFYQALEDVQTLLQDEDLNQETETLIQSLMQKESQLTEEHLFKLIKQYEAKVKEKNESLLSSEKMDYLKLSVSSLFLSIGNLIMLIVGLTSEVIEPLSVIIINSLGFIGIHTLLIAAQLLLANLASHTTSSSMRTLYETGNFLISTALSLAAFGIMASFFSTGGMIGFAIAFFSTVAYQSHCFDSIKKSTTQRQSNASMYDRFSKSFRNVFYLLNPLATIEKLNIDTDESDESTPDKPSLAKLKQSLFFKEEQESPSLVEQIKAATLNPT